MNKKRFFTETLPITITFTALLVCGIVFKQKFIKILPLFISLGVMLLNAKVNRIAFIIGGINAFIYCFGYYMEGLYGAVFGAIFSCVMQFITFFLWKKRPYGKATIVRSFKNHIKIILGVGIISVWLIMALFLNKIGGNEVVLDSLTSVLGYVMPFLVMFAFIEYVPLTFISSALSIVMWARIFTFGGDMASITYLIYSVYGFYMTVKGCIKWIKLYREQKQNKLENSIE